MRPNPDDTTNPDDPAKSEEPTDHGDPEGAVVDPTTLHVARARAGDAESLEWIVRRFTPLLLKSAEYRLGKRLRELHDPEDIVNDVWLAVLPSIAELTARDGRYTPVLLRYLTRTLLFRINNLIQKHIRGKPPKAHRPRQGAGGEGADPVDDLLAHATGIVTRIVRRETRDLVTEAIDALEERDRELIVLRGIEQRPYKEIAPLLGRDPKVLAVQYQRALEKLRRKLPGSVFEELEAS